MQTGFIKKLLFRGILFARSSGRRAFSFALEKTSSFTVISEIRKTRSDRLFQRATPFLFSSFSFQIYTKRERKRERERERELAVRRLNVPRFFSFHLRLFLAHWFPPFLLRFCFLNPLPSPPSLSLFDDRHFIFFTSAFARSSIPPFIFFLDFIPLSRSSRFLSSLPPLYPLDFYSHTLPLSFCPRTHPYPIHQPLSLSLSLSFSLPACRLVLFRLYPSIFVSVSFHQPRPLIITLFRALPGNSLLFFARFATRAVARATDKFCRDIAFGIIAIMSTKYLPCRPSRVCQPASASPRRVAPRV